VTNYVHFIIELLVEPLLEAHQQTYTRIAKKRNESRCCNVSVRVQTATRLKLKSVVYKQMPTNLK